MGRGEGRRGKGEGKANKRVGGVSRNVGSMSVSEQLPTYPSPNSTTVNRQQVKVNVELGEE